MATPKENKNFKEAFDERFLKIHKKHMNSLLDYMDFLVSQSRQRAWDDIPEVDEPLSEEEMKQLYANKQDSETITLEEHTSHSL